MFHHTKHLYKLATLYFMIWGSFLFSQSKILHLERTLLNSPELTNSNASLLHVLKDSVLFHSKTYYNYSKGNFTNYFEPNKKYNIGVKSYSYKRLNPKTVVYGRASYNFSKGRNSGGSIFLYPYRTPFNFTPKDEMTKGDIRIEKYQLVGALSYNIFKKINMGIKVNYQTINFVKLKDMRNTNDILDLTLDTGISYQITPKSTVGISYTYNRFIENLSIDKYGKKGKDYYALINSGTFMGFFELHGTEGILDMKTKKPWVDIVHSIGLQYRHFFSPKIKWFTNLQYENGKGFFGNDSDNSVVYMRHQKEKYIANTTISLQTKNTNHIIIAKANYDNTTNNEQLFREVTTKAGNTITQYYGERELLNKRFLSANITYNVLFGKDYFTAPIHISGGYTYNNIRRNTISFPFFRKQNITWHRLRLKASKNFKYKQNNIMFSCASNFITGNGGNPIDKKLLQNTDNVTPPDYLNNLLYKEKSYFTTKRFISELSCRASRNYNTNEVYIALKSSYTNPYKNTYLKGDFFRFGISLGLAF